MQSDFIAVPQFWTVGQTIDHMREADDLPDDFYEVFVVDPTYRLVGVGQLNRLLRSKRPTQLIDIMDETDNVVHATEDQEEVARRFERYDLVSAPVVDESERLVGVLTIDDMLDVIEEEADEDIRRLAGLGEAQLTDSVIRNSRSRLPWLVINTATAFLAAGVIGLFGASIEQMVALAVLMPIVASVGGNAGDPGDDGHGPRHRDARSWPQQCTSHDPARSARSRSSTGLRSRSSLAPERGFGSPIRSWGW